MGWRLRKTGKKETKKKTKKNEINEGGLRG
jgi:hypothetical protein